MFSKTVVFVLQAVSTGLGTGKVKMITKEEALLSKDIEVGELSHVTYLPVVLLLNPSLMFGDLIFVRRQSWMYS